MKRLLLLFVCSCLIGSAAHAGDGSAPLCTTPSLPNCVIANWGLVQPDGIEGLTSASESDRHAVVAPQSSKRMSAALLTTGLPTKPSNAAQRLNAVVSPDVLFRRETAALISALQRARFDNGGKIVKGQEQVAAAAARLVEKADAKYKLTIYVKVPQGIKPDDGALVSKKVRAVNDVLGSAIDQAPKSGS